jgi:hypothetical protein
MPRPGPRKAYVAVRVGPEELAEIDARAGEELPPKGNGEPNRSEMIRRLLDEAIAARVREERWPKL